MNRYLANVKDDPRAALILGMAAAQEEDGAPKAIPLLRAAWPPARGAQGELPARVAALRREGRAAARATFRTLRLSPEHERAKALLEQIGPQAPRARSSYKDRR